MGHTATATYNWAGHDVLRAFNPLVIVIQGWKGKNLNPPTSCRKDFRKVSKGLIVLMVFLQHIYIYIHVYTVYVYMYICIHIYLNALRGCSEIRTLFCVVWQPCSLYMVWNGSWCSWLLSSPSQHPSKVVLLKWSPSCDVWLPGEPWASPPFICQPTVSSAAEEKLFVCLKIGYPLVN